MRLEGAWRVKLARRRLAWLRREAQKMARRRRVPSWARTMRGGGEGMGLELGCRGRDAANLAARPDGRHDPKVAPAGWAARPV